MSSEEEAQHDPFESNESSGENHQSTSSVEESRASDEDDFVAEPEGPPAATHQADPSIENNPSASSVEESGALEEDDNVAESEGLAAATIQAEPTEMSIENKQSTSSVEESGASEEDDFVELTDEPDRLRAATYQATMREEQALMQDSFQQYTPPPSPKQHRRQIKSSGDGPDSTPPPTQKAQRARSAGSPKGSPKASPRGSPKTSPRLSPKGTSSQLWHKQFQRSGIVSGDLQAPDLAKGALADTGDGAKRSGSTRSHRTGHVGGSLRDISAPGDFSMRRRTASPEGMTHQSMRDLKESPKHKKDSKHSSVSHLNYHARKQDDDDWSETSDFELEWNPPVTQEDKEKKAVAGAARGKLDKHLLSGGDNDADSDKPISKTTGHDSIATIDVTVMIDDSDDIKDKIGDLKVKPVTQATRADKSASSTLFAQRKHQNIDQSVNLMDPKTGQYDTGSIGSGSGGSSSRSARRGNGRAHIISAPSRPNRYPTRTQKTETAASGFINASLMGFLTDSVSGGPKEDDSSLKEDRTSPTGDKKKPSFLCECKTFAVVWVILMVVGGAFVLIPLLKVQGAGEATKSWNNLVEVDKTDHFRDGTVILHEHPVTGKMSELTQQVTAYDEQVLSELQELILQHGISREEDLHWDNFQDNLEEFKTLTPQTKALIWLAREDTLHTQGRDVQHHKVFQRYALAVLYYSTHGILYPVRHAASVPESTNTGLSLTSFLDSAEHESSWINSDGWLSKKSVCTWYGIECNSEAVDDEVVLSLNLTHNGLHGTLPLYEMTATFRRKIRSIDLSGNDIMGDMGFGDMDNITNVDSVPWPHLRTLRLQDNRLSGSLPIDWLRICQEIEEINLSGNAFRGALPQHAFEYSDNLRRLHLDHNHLTGKVPVLGHLQKLEYLEIQNNAFSGRFPIGVFMLTTLVELRTGDNLLSGFLSTDLSNMINLEVLSVENNRLRGAVPDVFYTLPNMTQLVLRGNSFTGLLPESLGAMEKLEAIALEGNLFSGTVSSGLGSLTNLESLLLFKNQLTGTIPKEVCALKEGFFHFKKLRHLAVDCLAKVECSCCDECY